MKSCSTVRLFLLISSLAANGLAQGVFTETFSPPTPGSMDATNDLSPGNCVPPPSGIVGWWKGDGTAMDSVNHNNGVPVNVTYSQGVVGQAFAFDPENYPYGTYTGVQIADQPQYALTNALTIEGWIRPRGDGYIIFWRGDNRPGLDPYSLSMQGNQLLTFGICDAAGNSDRVVVTLPYGNWIHVAAAYDGTAGTLSIYTNAVLAAQEATAVVPSGNLIAGDSPGVGIGNLNDGQNNFPFIGDIDEIALYDRALAPAEVAAIYNAGSAGKCVEPIPPGISTQPASQTAAAGGGAAFSVVPYGTGPFSFQWTFNGHIIAGATNVSLSMTNLHLAQAGNYAVNISSPYGSVTSSNALLTVLAQSLLIYNYAGTETIVTKGQELTFPYSGMMFFLPETTNGAYVGCATIQGKKTYWVNDISETLWLTIPGNPGQSCTLFGDAGSGFDGNGQPHLHCNLLKGWNTTLSIGAKKTFVFPNNFAGENTHAFVDSATGQMKLDQATSTFTFTAPVTQAVNNTGQTLTDLINNQIKTLKNEGYQLQ